MTEQLDRFRDWRFGLFVHFGLYSAGRAARVGEEPRAADRRGLPAVLRPLRPRPVRPVVLGTRRAPGRDAVRRTDDEASRGLLPVGLRRVGLHRRRYAVRQGPGRSVRRGLPCRGARRRLLPLADRLAPPGVPGRRRPPAARRPRGLAGRQRDMSVYADYLHAQVRELLTRYGPIDIMWFDFSYPGHAYDDGTPSGKGRDDWRLRGAARDGARAAAGDPGQRPARPARAERLRHAGAVPAVRADHRDGEPVRWEACQTLNGSWGYDRDNLDCEVAGPAGPDAGRLGLQGRQPAAQRRADRPRRVRPAGAGHARRGSASGCGCTSGRCTGCRTELAARGRRRTAAHAARRPAVPAPVRLAVRRTSTCPGSPDRVRYAQLLHDASEVQRDGASTRTRPRRTRPWPACRPAPSPWSSRSSAPTSSSRWSSSSSPDDRGRKGGGCCRYGVLTMRR